jgi:hypothetical protein
MIAPAANKRESPGKNGVTTKPVSAKMMRKKYQVGPGLIILNDLY